MPDIDYHEGAAKADSGHGPSLALVVLAAGGGRRLGGGKLLLPWRGKPILLHVLEKAAALAGEIPVSTIALVLGHEAAKVRETLFTGNAFRHPLLRCIGNARWAEGQSGSLRLGIEAVRAAPGCAEICGAMVMLGDQVLLGRDTLRMLGERHCEAVWLCPAHPATAPYYSGRRGNPVVLSPCLFPLLAGLRGDVGARDILAGLGDKLLRVEVDDPGVCLDLDTPEDYADLPE